ncbi:hypothetical protein T265_05981 [Rhizophagus irregularis DAOM 181602=DAOM 197198]|nr:hypothetical protein T265_05981 [Rhizophagus irregularis DAOM 181602=DAOM 197198]
MFLSKLSKLLKKESSFVKLCKVNNMSDNNDNNENDSKTSNKNFESEDKPEWYEAHKLAIQNNQHFYIDPVTGYKCKLHSSLPFHAVLMTIYLRL